MSRSWWWDSCHISHLDGYFWIHLDILNFDMWYYDIQWDFGLSGFHFSTLDASWRILVLQAYGYQNSFERIWKDDKGSLHNLMKCAHGSFAFVYCLHVFTLHCTPSHSCVKCKQKVHTMECCLAITRCKMLQVFIGLVLGLDSQLGLHELQDVPLPLRRASAIDGLVP